MESTDSSVVNIVQPRQDDAPSKVELTIRHQFYGIELVSPVYVGDVACYLSPDQRVNVGSTTRASFNIDPSQGESIGALIYKLERTSIDEFDEDTTFVEEGTCLRLFII
jgi:hypothetical protein